MLVQHMGCILSRGTKAVTRVPFTPTSSHVNVIVSLSPGAQVTIFKVCLLTSGVHSSVGVAYGDGSKYMSLGCSGKCSAAGGGTGDFMYTARWDNIDA